MSYPGSKAQAGVWQRIIGQMPPHSVYVEPFFGSGQVFWRKRRAPSSILIDSNPRVISAANAKLGVDAGVRAIVGDSLRMLPELFAWLPADAVCYCDPPYLLRTRTKQLLYRFHGATDELSDDDHGTLLAALLEAKCRVLISGYPSDLYSSRLHGWRCLEYDTMTRGGKRRECLWCNFDEPEDLHDWRFAGFDHRARFGMKRFVRRWLDRIESMPGRKRGYVLNELQEAIAQRQPRRDGPQRQPWRGVLADPATPPLALPPDIATPPLALAAATRLNGTATRLNGTGRAGAIGIGNGHANSIDAKAIAVLCCSGRSIYKHMPGVVAYDRARDARTFDAKTPAVAHPPCRLWSKYLSHQAKSPDREAEMELGRWCVRTVMKCGGVVEQPAGSRLWQEMNLPVPNAPASDGCYTIYVEQRWFGYATRKPTWLLICGVPKDQLPPVPFNLVECQPKPKPRLSSFARSRTMTSFAEWLCQIARRAKPSRVRAPSSSFGTAPHAIGGAGGHASRAKSPAVGTEACVANGGAGGP